MKASSCAELQRGLLISNLHNEMTFYSCQVEDLQEELRRKEARWSAATARLKDRIEVLDTENGELRKEIAFLEKKRLEGWQAREASTSVSSIKY